MSSSSAADSSSPTRTSELRKDPVFSRWVIFSPARSRRPSDLKSRSPASNPSPHPSSCPFCAGHEHECAPEIFRVPTGPSAANWKVRVIENLYPALRREEEPPSHDSDGVLVLKGFGFHDVVIETPVHGVHLPDLDDAEVADVVLAFKRRVLQLKKLGSIKYVQVFKNYGASAGASLSHAHSQIIGLPMVPPLVSTRLDSMKDYFDRNRKCALCDIQIKEILVHESSHFFSIVPFAASFPFEIWIIPRDHTVHFHELDDERAVDFGCLLKLMLFKLSRQLNDPPFNFMIHTAPFELPASCLPSSHWFLQIVPHLNSIGGFEMGSGCYINAVFPEDAAKILREVKSPRIGQQKSTLFCSQI